MIASKSVDTKAMYLLVNHPEKLPAIIGPYTLAHQRDMIAVSIHTSEEKEPTESDLFMVDLKENGTLMVIPYPPKFFDHLYARKALFSIEDRAEYPGYTDGARWNGWAMPYFIKEVAKKVLVDFTGEEGYDHYTFPKEDSVIIINPDTGKPIQVWPIGSGGWCWKEHDLEEKNHG